VTSGSEKLYASPASIVQDYVVNTLSKMTDPEDGAAWPLFVNAMPDDDIDNVATQCGAVYDTTGTQDLRSSDGSWPEHPGIQLAIRARDYETGYSKIEDIANALDAVSNDTIVIGAYQYKIFNISRTSSIINLGMDNKSTSRRFTFTVNFLLTIREMTT
jgi:hypothetical protein